MANDVNILCVKYVNMPNTIFKATKAEEEKKISKIHCMEDLLNSGDTWEVK